MSERSSRGSWAWVADLAIAALVTTGYGAPVGVLVLSGVTLAGSALAGHRGLGSSLSMAVSGLVAMAIFAGWVIATLKAYQHIRDRGRRPFVVAVQVLALLLFPAWGLALNQVLTATCRTSTCDPGPEMFRVFSERGLAGLVALHALTALAFVVSRRRPERLPPIAELLVHAAMFAGIALQGTLALQTADLLWGLVAFPITLPLLAPYVTIALYGRELVDRLRRRGAEALAPPERSPDAPYRAPTLAEVPNTVDGPVHRPLLVSALVASPWLLGAHGVVMAVLHRRPTAALDVFTQTCGHALSRLPVEHIVVHDCHYLCTVAARGTPSLVRPERMGVRNGHPIVVNRQLAVANAFEDLLHTRWPRFGRLARDVYDRVGLPVSRYITRGWMADAVYLAMKPFEWGFYATLLLLDRDDPERRIDRMYR